MDIKDFILIGGGILIAAVIVHGFWIAWRERQRDLRFDIQPDLIPNLIDDMDRLKGELPNGGARVSKNRREIPAQDTLILDDPPPLLLEPSAGPPPAPAKERTEARTEPRIEVPATTTGNRSSQRSDFGALRAQPERAQQNRAQSGLPTRTNDRANDSATSRRAKVTDVSMPDSLVPEQSRHTRRMSQRQAPERSPVGVRGPSGERSSDRASERAAERATQRAETVTAPPVEELLILNVLADTRAPYAGDALFTVLRAEGLKFADMNIFHRVEPLTKIVHFSVANAVEPGTFDMLEMESFRSPGLCFFMQLPGPENPLEAFEDMLKVARTICRTLGGEIKDEQPNVMTPQTVEHYRQRVLEFSRRRMSKRA